MTRGKSMMAALALVIGTPALASAERFELGIGTTAHYAQDGSVDALSERDVHPFFSLGFGVRIDAPRIPGFDLVVEGTLERGSIDGTSFQRLDSSTAVTTVMGGARLRRRFPGRTSAYGRLGIGVSKMSFELRDRYTDSLAAHDRGYVPTSYLGAGVELLPVRRTDDDGNEKLAIGIGFEVGYFASASLDMRAIPDDDAGDDAIRIPTEPASLGSLDVSGFSYRLSFVGRF